MRAKARACIGGERPCDVGRAGGQRVSGVRRCVQCCQATHVFARHFTAALARGGGGAGSVGAGSFDGGGGGGGWEGSGGGGWSGGGGADTDGATHAAPFVFLPAAAAAAE